MATVNEEAVLEQLSRYYMKLFFEQNDFHVNNDYTVHMRINGEDKIISILHFDRVKIEGENIIMNFVDFLDTYFVQKRSIIINNLAKCLDIKPSERGKDE